MTERWIQMALENKQRVPASSAAPSWVKFWHVHQHSTLTTLTLLSLIATT
jgi:hypothetical protein